MTSPYTPLLWLVMYVIAGDPTRPEPNRRVEGTVHASIVTAVGCIAPIDHGMDHAGHDAPHRYRLPGGAQVRIPYLLATRVGLALAILAIFLSTC